MARAGCLRPHSNKVADTIYGFYAGKGYSMSQETFRKALATVDVNPEFPSELQPYMERHIKSWLYPTVFERAPLITCPEAGFLIQTPI